MKALNFVSNIRVMCLSKLVLLLEREFYIWYTPTSTSFLFFHNCSKEGVVGDVPQGHFGALIAE